MFRIFFFWIFAASSISLGLGLHAQRTRTQSIRENSLTPAVKFSEISPENYTFRAFVSDFNRQYDENSPEWQRRQAIFLENLLKLTDIRKKFVNEKSNTTWKPSITMFLDYDEKERKNLLGYKRTGPFGALEMSSTGRNSTISQSNEQETEKETTNKLPSHFTTLSSGKTLTGRIRNQGACGSCWAEAAVATVEGVLETQSEMMHLLNKEMESVDDKYGILSTQAIVRCTENPKNCGGTGGCHGATTELGFEMVKKHGLPLASHWPYTASTGKCELDRFEKTMLISIDSYRTLPKNKLEPLMAALVEKGHPIAVSVDATQWHMYSTGIYSDTDMGDGDFTINHAVALMAYQNPGYWLIKNSWGSYYGEDGFIRLEFKENEGKHCGWDRNTHVGIACDGDKDVDWVCGTCGILYDTSYPEKVNILK